MINKRCLHDSFFGGVVVVVHAEIVIHLLLRLLAVQTAFLIVLIRRVLPSQSVQTGSYSNTD